MAESKLGQFTEDTERDAVHVAVLPAVLAVDLPPGAHVSVVKGVAYPGGVKVGIIDPFLEGKLEAGDKVWVLMYPNTVKNLRHDWSHPDVPEVKEVVYVDYSDECSNC